MSKHLPLLLPVKTIEGIQRTIKKLILFFFIISSIICCKNEENIKPNKSNSIEQAVKIKTSGNLLNRVEKTLGKSQNSRYNSTYFELDSAVKVLDDITNRTTYSFRSFYADNTEFSNLVYIEQGENSIAYILTYSFDEEYPYSIDYDFSSFTGVMEGFDLTGEKISFAEVINGVINPIKDNKAGRLALPPLPEGNGCYELIRSTATPNEFWQPTPCPSEGPSSGTSLGDSGAGHIGSSGSAGGGSDPGHNGSDGIGDESHHFTGGNGGVGVFVPDYPDYDDSMAEAWEENNITLTDAFKNNPCAKGVYDDLNRNNDVYDLLSGFMGASPTAKLKLTLNPNLLPNVGGRTINGTNRIVIQMNSNIFDSQSKLSVAQFLLHEFVHAELFNASNSNDVNFENLFNDYADAQVGSTQHNIMINNYISRMGSILASLDNNAFELDYYHALSYRGLTKTDFWLNEIKGTANETIIESFQVQVLNGREPCE